ncbi:MAG: hypothetical protein WCF99_16335 [Chloroflexales bacterium]
MSALFLMWYDDNPKLTVAMKIEDAMGAYRNRFRTVPTLVLVNEEDVVDVVGVEVRGVTTVRRNTVWVGLDRERHESLTEDTDAKVVKVGEKVTDTKPRKRRVHG